jgi:hypothetical protein
MRVAKPEIKLTVTRQNYSFPRCSPIPRLTFAMFPALEMSDQEDSLEVKMVQCGGDLLNWWEGRGLGLQKACQNSTR